jgi:hypothetical protein
MTSLLVVVLLGTASVLEPRGAVVIEPPRLTLGEVAVVDITVVTPPGYRVRPVRPPETLPGLWLLDAERLPVERSEARWVHRTRLRVRARETGRFAWPPTSVEVETPEGSVMQLELEERPLEVASVSERFPERVEPFPLRAPEPPASGPGIWLPAAGGVLAMLAGLAALASVRRARSRRRPPEPAARATSPPPWRAAQATLEAAIELAAQDPGRCADSASHALRGFVAQRFPVPAWALTTEELAALEPPTGGERHWPRLLDLLARLDAVRFRPAGEGPGGVEVERLRATLAEAQRLVAEATPEARFR